MKHSPWFELECIVTTCLYLASKVEDTARRVSDVCNVVRRCRLRLQKEAGEEEVKEEEKREVARTNRTRTKSSLSGRAITRGRM